MPSKGESAIGIGSGFLRGFGGEFIRQKDRKDKESREDFERKHSFLIGELGREDLTPEGKQFVSGSLRDLYGKGGGGKNPMDFYDTIQQLYGSGGTVPETRTEAGTAPAVEVQLPEQQQRPVTASLQPGEDPTTSASLSIPAQMASVGPAPSGQGAALVSPETQIQNPFFRSLLEMEREKLTMRGEVQGEAAQAQRQQRLDSIDAMEREGQIDPQTANLARAQINTGMNLPARREEKLVEIYDEKTKQKRLVPQSMAAGQPTTGPEQEKFGQMSETGQFIQNRIDFYEQTAPGMDEDDIQQRVADDLDKFEADSEEMDALDQRAKQALIDARNRRSQQSDEEAEISVRQAITIANSSAMRMAQIAVNTRLQHDMPLQDQLQDNPNLVAEMIQQAYEDILLNQFGIPIETIQRVIGGAVNTAGGGAGGGIQSNPNFVPLE